jgi:hypothetical protein
MRTKMIALVLAAVATGCLDGFSFSDRTRDDGLCVEFACLWQAEQGTIEAGHSWDEDVFSNRLAGTPARITRKVDVPYLYACLEVIMHANVAKDALVELQWDFGDDQSIDARTVLEPGLWTRRKFYQRTPNSVRHLRLHLAKQGPGEFALDDIELRNGFDNCAELPALTLANDSACLDDASCTSGYCVLGKCSACGAGGCGEGSACREDKDCLGGACAAGVCRACAASGSCGTNEGCSNTAQCASRSCTFGAKPSLVRYPELDGVCGECSSDAQCGGRRCVLGQCADCATDADCTGGLRCRYLDISEAGTRSCLPRFDGVLPRNALCEVDAECADGLRCGAPPDRARRCGFACKSSMDCGANEVCGNTGTAPSTTQPGVYEVLPAFAQANSRISTCYPKDLSTSDPLRRAQLCSVHAQCGPSSTPYVAGAFVACCSGGCSQSGLDLATGMCGTSVSSDLVRYDPYYYY